MKSKFLLLGLCGLAFTWAGRSHPAKAESEFAVNDNASIVGGEQVTDKSSQVYLHTVRLLNSGVIANEGVPQGYEGKKISWRCSGTLIGKRLVLTAGHCFPKGFFIENPDKPGAPLFVPFSKVTGSVFFKRNSREDVSTGSPVLKFAVHPEFQDDWMYRVANAWNPKTPVSDIALAVLGEDYPSEKATTNLVTGTQKLVSGDELVLAGYGKSGTGGEIEIPALRSVKVPFRAMLENRTDMFAGTGSIDAPSTAENPQGACSGDSGGPAYLPTAREYLLAGIIVRGPDSGHGGCLASVSILTDIRAYTQWISTTSKKLLE